MVLRSNSWEVESSGILSAPPKLVFFSQGVVQIEASKRSEEKWWHTHHAPMTLLFKNTIHRPLGPTGERGLLHGPDAWRPCGRPCLPTEPPSASAPHSEHSSAMWLPSDDQNKQPCNWLPVTLKCLSTSPARTENRVCCTTHSKGHGFRMGLVYIVIFIYASFRCYLKVIRFFFFFG